MSGGGLMQLVAYGAQDVYLTANPQVTFFKQLYRRHSNFAMESIEQTFNGVANFGKRVQCTISRNGDLISRVYLQATLPSVDVSVATGAGLVATNFTTFKWVENVGQALVSYVELEIGGQLIDKHYGDWMYIWNELTLPVGKQAAFDMMVGSGLIASSNATATTGGPCTTCGSVEPGPCSVNSNAGLATLCSKGDGNSNTNALQCCPEYTLYVPLEFWFCRHSGLALPLIALQYHEVKVNIQFATLNNLCNIKPASLTAVTTSSPKKVYNAVNQSGLVAASLWADYVYLDTEERRRFAQVAHEYLIEQLQFTGAESVTAAQNNIKMSFNHPVKELVWVTQLDKNIDCNYGSDITVSAAPLTYTSANKPFNYADDSGANPTAVAKIQLNGHDRFDARFGSYFNFVQPYQHHTGSPAIGINVYSFALKPEEHQPSGTCNFSRIDNAVLNLTLSPFTLKSAALDVSTSSTTVPTAVGTALTAQVRIYAVNYNVLRVMSGMGGLAYSN